jgi:hypothetical protein
MTSTLLKSLHALSVPQQLVHEQFCQQAQQHAQQLSVSVLLHERTVLLLPLAPLSVQRKTQ